MSLPECTQDPKEDLGSGIQIERRYLDGVLGGIAWWHNCGVDYPAREDWIPTNAPGEKRGWDVEHAQPLTLSPSILCRRCGRHGFIRAGKWVAA